MPTLVLLAGTAGAITVPCQRAGKSSPRQVGSVSPSANGALRSSVRGQAKVIPVLVPKVDTATEAAIQAAIMNGVQISCSGEILGNIQTLCSVDCTDSHLILGRDGEYEMSLTLNEVTPSTVLLKYAPGDAITGAVFTRSTVAQYRNANGDVVTAGIDVKRDGHYIGGIRSLLLEETRQNICLQSQVLGTTWTPVNGSIGSDLAASPSTAINADKIQEDTANGQHAVTQTITCASAVQTFSIWVKAGERTKCVVAMSDNTTGSASIGVDLTNGTTFASGIAVGSWTGISAVVESWGNGWYRVMVTGTRGAGTQTLVQVFNWTTSLSYAGTLNWGVYPWGGQLEMAAFASSYIVTTTVAVTRGADLLSFPFTTPPQEMSAYASFVELGTARANTFLFGISNAAGNGAIYPVLASGGFYRARHDSSGASSVTSTLAAAPAYNQANEIDARLFGDGSVDITQSIAGAASTTAAQSAANTPATAWSDALLWLNSMGNASTRGYVAIRSLKIVAGMRSLAEMRAA